MCALAAAAACGELAAICGGGGDLVVGAGVELAELTCPGSWSTGASSRLIRLDERGEEEAMGSLVAVGR